MHLTQQAKLVAKSSRRDGFKEQASSNVSVVVPAYCEERNLVRLYEEITAALTDVSWELIIVDDGSTDDTWKEISLPLSARRILMFFLPVILPVSIPGYSG